MRYELLLRDTLKRREGLLMVVSTSLVQFRASHAINVMILSLASQMVSSKQSSLIRSSSLRSKRTECVGCRLRAGAVAGRQSLRAVIGRAFRGNIVCFCYSKFYYLIKDTIIPAVLIAQHCAPSKQSIACAAKFRRIMHLSQGQI